jgi:acetyltransferase-like isoleucine patch superfamily enzyme
VNEQGMVGAMALATKDVRPYHVNVGIPAKSVRIKSTAPRGDDVLSTARSKGV